MVQSDWTSDLAEHVEDRFGIADVKIQGFGILEGEDGLFELLQPGPHDSSEDEGISFRAQPLPCTALIQLCLHTFKLQIISY